MFKKDVEAYILIVVQHGAEHKVLEDLMKIDGVKEGSSSVDRVNRRWLPVCLVIS